MEIEPHPDNPKKVLVTPEDILEASFLRNTIPAYREAFGYFSISRGLWSASFELSSNNKPDPVVMHQRQLRFMGQRLVNQELPRQLIKRPENVYKIHAMAEQIFDYLGIRLGKGG